MLYNDSITVTEVEQQAEDEKEKDFFHYLRSIRFDANVEVVDKILKDDGNAKQ